MLEASAFLRVVVARSPLYYVEMLAKFCPMHAVGLVWGVLQIRTRGNDGRCFVLALWPLTFLVALSLLGTRGAGFQGRFLLPCMPAPAILGALAIEASPQSPLPTALCALCLAHSAMHCLYYGVLFSPFHADLDLSVLEMVFDVIWQSPYHPPESREQLQSMRGFLAHFGVRLN